MLKSGKEYLETLRDGRVIYLGSEKIDDVTAHPAFRNAARTVASLYDRKAADDLTIVEDGERCSAYYQRAQNKYDLEKRTACHRAIADMTYGMFGRSPDHVASFVTGMATNTSVFGAYADNLMAYYRYMYRNDLYTVYAIIPHQAARHGDFYASRKLPNPALHVAREEDDGVVISGVKVLATGAVLANEIWIGNITPLAPDQASQSITCAVPVNAPGLSLWSRQSFEQAAQGKLESPLAHDFDETDSVLVCDNVKVPWERVFVHNDAAGARNIYLETPGHCYGNHQSNVRFWSKLRFLVGLARRVAVATGMDQQGNTKEALGVLASWEALIGGLIMGQIQAAENWPHGYMTYNRRIMYATLQWCTEHHSTIIDMLRDLSSSHVFQMPAHGSVLDHAVLEPLMERLMITPQLSARERMKLFKVVWDVVGSEFAGRHQQYEKFYAGAPAVVRNYNFMHAPWAELDVPVASLIDHPQPLGAVAE